MFADARLESNPSRRIPGGIAAPPGNASRVPIRIRGCPAVGIDVAERSRIADRSSISSCSMMIVFGGRTCSAPTISAPERLSVAAAPGVEQQKTATAPDSARMDGVLILAQIPMGRGSYPDSESGQCSPLGPILRTAPAVIQCR